MANQERTRVIYTLMVAALLISSGTRLAIAAGPSNAKIDGAAQTTSRDELLLAVSPTDSTLSIIKVDGKTLTLLGTVPVGQGAREEVCVSADGKRAYVSNDKDNTTTAVDLEARKVIATIALPGIKHAEGCAESPDGKKLYVAGMESGTVAIVSVPTHKMLKTIEVGEEPRRFAFTPDGRRVYVTSEDAKTIRLVDVASDKIVDSFESGGLPRILVPLPDQKTLLVANVDSDSASLIDIATKKVNLTIGVGSSPQRVEISRDGAWAYILSVSERKISAVDLKGAYAPYARTRHFVSVGGPSHGMALSEDGSLLFVSEPADNRIVAFDTGAINALGNNSSVLAELPPVAKLTINKPTGIAIRRSAQ